MANDIKVLNHAADNIRILAAAAVEKAKSGHPGGAMGGADFINVLYSEYLKYDPKNPEWVGRDRFFLDPGHMAPMLYSQLCLAGKFTLDELAQLRQWGSPTTGHPEFEVARGIENTSGPLGQGHASDKMIEYIREKELLVYFFSSSRTLSAVNSGFLNSNTSSSTCVQGFCELGAFVESLKLFLSVLARVNASVSLPNFVTCS